MTEQAAGLLMLLGVGFGVAWAGVALYSSWMLTHPVRRGYAAALARGRPGEPGELDAAPPWHAFSVESRGQSLAAWEIVGENPQGPTLVMTHGWSDGKVGGLVRAEPLLSACRRIVLWDMPGQGDSPGRCDLGWSEPTDLGAVLNSLEDPSQIVLYGWSMGAGVSIAAAADDDRVAGVIAEAPYRSAFTPAKNVLRSRGLPWRLTLGPALSLLGLLRGRGPLWMLRGSWFDRAELAGRVACPLLVLHGTRDVISPIEDGRDIAQAAPRGRLIEIEDATHNGMWTADATRDHARRRTLEFLADVD
ncbi:MAG: alpha/beta hydrolase [Planctomycetota bacterium]